MTQKVAIAGAAGRMGRTLIEGVLADPQLSLAGAFEQAGNPLLGRDAGESFGRRTGVIVTDDAAAALAGAGVLIDFTRPEATLAHLQVCRQRRGAAVIGTTGFDADGKRAIQDASRDIAIVFAPNMSVGVNVTLKLLEMAARILGSDYDMEIIEAHHKHKVDAPSGTALRMGEVLAAALGKPLQDVGVFERHGVTGERKPGTIGFATVRAGDIVGDHTAIFAGTGERIEIIHRATSRANFAAGALRAARFLGGKTAGLFDMQDVLGLR